MTVSNLESRTTPNSMHRSTKEKTGLYFVNNQRGTLLVNNQRGTDYQIRSLEFPNTPLLYSYTPAGFNECFSPAALRGAIVSGNLHNRQHIKPWRCIHTNIGVWIESNIQIPRHGRIYILLHDVHYDTVGSTNTRCTLRHRRRQATNIRASTSERTIVHHKC